MSGTSLLAASFALAAATVAASAVTADEPAVRLRFGCPGYEWVATWTFRTPDGSTP